MLSIVFCFSSDLFLGFPGFMWPKYLLNSIYSFSMSSKVLSPFCMFLKMCSGPLKPLKPYKNILNY